MIHAMHEFVDRIGQAFFVAATMLPFGFQADEDKNDVMFLKNLFAIFLNHIDPPTLPENEIELTLGAGADDPPTTIALRPEFQRDRLSQQSHSYFYLV